jgi:hypothetical protein
MLLSAYKSPVRRVVSADVPADARTGVDSFDVTIDDHVSRRRMTTLNIALWMRVRVHWSLQVDKQGNTSFFSLLTGSPLSSTFSASDLLSTGLATFPRLIDV